ncbi:MAG: stage 0 sporulation family protein [Selenomonadaceae bacterium]|nr:stage 0 sporulation family protein [Selenomonadaceae bacterium]
MQTVVGVRFKKAGKIYYFDPGELDIKKNDGVIVETVRGVEYGEAVLAPREVEDTDTPYRLVLRKATEEDLAQLEENKKREKEAAEIFEEQVKKHSLEMKLVNVECTFDMSKIIFYFTADGRVDFRALVKDLAAVFRTRIELRQIGVRDEAKSLGGVGACGRPICCAQFLGDFEPVSIKMAKDQNLSLNPTKISGICGRLMCCLKYEQYAYEGMEQKRVEIVEPEQGSRVITGDGEGKVISTNKAKRTATILLDDGKTAVLPWDDILKSDDDDIIVEVQSEKPVNAEQDKKNVSRETMPKNFEKENKRRDFPNNYQKRERDMQGKFREDRRERREHRETREFKNEVRRDRRMGRENIGYGGYGKPAWHNDD